MNQSVDVTRDYNDVSELFSAMSSPVRAAIVHRLTEDDQTVSGLVTALGLSQPLISQHLRILRGARLVSSVRQGREVTYMLTDDHVAHVFLDALNHSRESSHDDH